MRSITVGGVEAAVHAECSGAEGKPDLILVHGAGCDHNVFRYQTRYFAGRGHRVFAIDLPGHGASAGPALDSISSMGRWLIEAMSVLGCDEAVLVGHSMGALAAIEAAVSGSDVVRGLVLIGASDRMLVHPELLAAAGERDGHAIDLMVGWMHTGDDRLGGHRSAGTWSAGSSRRILERNLGVLGGDLSACAEYDPVPSVGRLSMPTLTVSAGADKMTPPSAGKRLAAEISGGRLVMIENGGHMAFWERSTEVNEAIARFLSDLELGSTS